MTRVKTLTDFSPSPSFFFFFVFSFLPFAFTVNGGLSFLCFLFPLSFFFSRFVPIFFGNFWSRDTKNSHLLHNGEVAADSGFFSFRFLLKF